jgi:hypothetical protein
MKMWMVLLRRIDVRTSMPYAMASVLLGVCPQTRAQESDARFYFPDPKPVNIPLAREVHMSELPAVNGGGRSEVRTSAASSHRRGANQAPEGTRS